MSQAPNRNPALDEDNYRTVAGGRYRKSSYSGNSNACVTLARVGGLVGVQDDKLAPDDRTAGTLVFPAGSMRTFLREAGSGRFDTAS